MISLKGVLVELKLSSFITFVQIFSIIERKVNSKRQHSGCLHYLQGKCDEPAFCSLIDSLFAQIKATKSM